MCDVRHPGLLCSQRLWVPLLTHACLQGLASCLTHIGCLEMFDYVCGSSCQSYAVWFRAERGREHKYMQETFPTAQAETPAFGLQHRQCVAGREERSILCRWNTWDLVTECTQWESKWRRRGPWSENVLSTLCALLRSTLVMSFWLCNQKYTSESLWPWEILKQGVAVCYTPAEELHDKQRQMWGVGIEDISRASELWGLLISIEVIEMRR